MKNFFKISAVSLLAGISLSLTACGNVGNSSSNGNSSALGAGAAVGSCQNPQDFTFDPQIGLCCVLYNIEVSDLYNDPGLCEATLNQKCITQNPATPYAQFLDFNGQNVQLTCVANPY